MDTKTRLELPRDEEGNPLGVDGDPIRRMDLVEDLMHLLAGTPNPGETIEEMIATDSYDDVTVESVREVEGGEWQEVCWNGGTCTALPTKVKIEVGDTIRFYPGAGWGARHYGWAVNGEVVEWATPWERLVKDLEWLAGHDREQREKFAADREEMDAAYDALPDPLKARIDRFRAEDPRFRVESEAYEMAAVGDAPKIAAALEPEIDALEQERGTEEWLTAVADIFDAYREKEWAEQKALVPDLQEGHSGNTFGAAVGLGYRYACGLEV